MPFSVSQIVVCDTTKKVTALDWTYSNADGSVGNQWQLEQPYGDVPLASCTESVLIGMLTEQLPNTAEDFDAQIAANKARAEEEATLQDYTPHADGPPTPVTQEIDVPDLPEAKTAKAKKK